MRGQVFVGAMAVLGAVAGPAMAGSALKVKPHYGHPSTVFRVSFADSDESSSLNRTYSVRVSAPARNGHCVSSASRSVSNPKHARVRMRLDPAKLGGQWCRGSFHGTVEELLSPRCQAHVECPQFIAMRTVGHFTFRVRRSTAH